jgi:hypothetical protein
MIKPTNNVELVAFALAEIKHLNKVATQAEKDRLNATALNKYEKCIYNQMTGNFDGKRARELKQDFVLINSIFGTSAIESYLFALGNTNHDFEHINQIPLVAEQIVNLIQGVEGTSTELLIPICEYFS